VSEILDRIMGQVTAIARRVAHLETLEGGGGGAGHDAVMLDADAAVLLDLTTQEIGLDVQNANAVFAGPATGAANEPTFRALVAADLVAHTQNASTIIIPNGVGSPAFDDMQDFLQETRSSGRISGGLASAHLVLGTPDGTVDMSEMTGMIFTTDALGGSYIFFKMAATASIALTDLSVNWVYFDWSGGTPQYLATVTRSDVNEYDQFTVARVFRRGTALEIQLSGHSLYNKDRRSHNRLILKYGGMDWVSGAILTQHATALRLSCSIGSWYIANTAFPTAAADTFILWYRTGGSATWVESAALTLFSAVFDGVGAHTVYETYQNGTSLGALTGNKYGVYWVFLCPTGHLNIVLGTSTYANISAAQAATVPTSANLPNICTNWARLIGRVICKNAAAALFSVESVFTTQFTLSTAVDHAGLANLTYASAGHTGWRRTIVFEFVGTLSLSTGTIRIYPDGNWVIDKVWISVSVAPTGANIIVDVHKNGTTIFTDQAKRPEIAAAGFTDESATPDVVALTNTDYLTMDVDQVGSTITGQDLTVHVRATETV